MIKIRLTANNRAEMEMLKEVMKETFADLNQQIRKETRSRCIETRILYEDESIVQGYFKVANGKEGTFSFCKSIVPALVLNVC